MATSPEGGAKLPYQAPQLTDLGPLSELTRGGGAGNHADGAPAGYPFS